MENGGEETLAKGTEWLMGEHLGVAGEIDERKEGGDIYCDMPLSSLAASPSPLGCLNVW